MSKTKSKSFLTFIFILVCSFLLSLYKTNNPFMIGYTGTDSSVFNYVAKVILKGGMPYRDTFDHKGPLIYLIDALGLCINKDIGVWIMELITLIITFAYTYKIARLLNCNRINSLLTVAVGVLALAYHFEGGNLTEEYACPFIVISLYIFMKYFKYGKISIYEVAFCGISFGAICMLRINMISLWVVMCICVIIKCIKDKQFNDILGFTAWFLAGIAIIVVPILFWLIKNNAFIDFINDYFVFNFMYSSDPETAGMFNIAKIIAYTLTVPTLAISISILVIICICYNCAFDWQCLIALILSVVMSCMSGRYYGHYGMSWYAMVVFAVARLISQMVKIENKKYLLSVSAVAVCVGLFAFNSIILDFTIFMTKQLPKGLNWDENFNQVKEVALKVKSNTAQGEKITVCGNCNSIYLLSKRESASKYSYQYPIAEISDGIRKEYIENIKSERPRIIVLRVKHDWALKSEILSEDYKKIYEIDDYEVYHIDEP